MTEYSERQRFQNGYPTHDWTTRKNAEHLASRIKDYWNSRGFVSPKTEVTNISTGKGTFALTSDMVNGFPRNRKPT